MAAAPAYPGTGGGIAPLLRNSVPQKRELLQGEMDGNGCGVGLPANPHKPWIVRGRASW